MLDDSQTHGLDPAEEPAGAVADVERDLFVDRQVPLHGARVAHPLRVRGGRFGRDAHAAAGALFVAVAVCRLDRKRRVGVDVNILE